jgi:hypothetical protein
MDRRSITFLVLAQIGRGTIGLRSKKAFRLRRMMVTLSDSERAKREEKSLTGEERIIAKQRVAISEEFIKFV